MSTRLPGTKYKCVFDAGRVKKCKLFTAWILVRDDNAGPMAGVVVSKRCFHDATDRNRAKRILREAFRLTVPELARPVWCILAGRVALRDRKMQDVAIELRRMLCARS